MDRDSEALQRSLLRLLQELLPETSLVDVEAISQGLGWDGEGGGEASYHHSLHAPKAFAPQDDHSVIPSQNVSEAFSPQKKSSLESGDIPAVQDRFHALLKRRLETEIQRNPPLFPWETEVHDYEIDRASYGVFSSAQVSGATAAANQRVPARLWLDQLRNLNLPVAVPDAVLTQLFQRCQEAVRSSLLEGAKLVRAVEELFPDRAQALNYLAGVVMTSPARSGMATVEQTDYLKSYEEAESTQQMILSLMAAREIINALTLTVSPAQPTLERQWLTELGLLTLQVVYEPTQPSKLRVQGSLPCGGGLVLHNGEVEAIAHRPNSGLVSVELLDLQPTQLCELEIQFANQDQSPLIFRVSIAAV